eukprot:tig00000133_g7668.t2
MWGSGRRFSIAWTVSSDGIPPGCAACVDAAQSFETLFRRALADGVKAVRVKYCDSETSTASMRAACQSASFGAAAAPTDAPWPLLPCGVRSHESIIVCHHFRSALWLWARAPFRMRELDGTGTEFQSPRSSSFALGRGHVHARHEELEVPFEAELESDQPALDLVLRREELSVRYRAFRLERVLPSRPQGGGHLGPCHRQLLHARYIDVPAAAEFF